MRSNFIPKVLFLLLAVFLISCGDEETKKEEVSNFDCSECKASETCDTTLEKCIPIEGYCELDTECNAGEVCDLDSNTCKEEIVVDKSTIYPIRKGSVAVDSTVTAKGIITGIWNDGGVLKGFYIQEAGEDYRGIFVYASKTITTTLTIGDELSVTGTYTEYNGLSEIIIDSNSDIVKSGINSPIEDFTEISVDKLLSQQLEEYESMLVIVKGRFIIGERQDFDNIIIKTENGMRFLIKDDFYDLSSLVVDGKLAEISGVLTFSYGKFKILPRGEEDLVDNTIVCSQVNCVVGETCEVNDNVPSCVCDLANGFFDDGNGVCVSPCADDTCVEDNKTTCVSSSSTDYTCECNTGFELEDDGTCIESPYCNPNLYYSALGLTGSDLREELKTIVEGNYQVYSYEPAKAAMFSHIDNEDGKVMGVYTGQYYNHPYESDPNYQTKTNETEFNCEHTWPQSKLSGGGKSDLHHLFPSFARVNSARSNYPFGEVTDGDTFGFGDYISEVKNEVFEPADQHKGNVARAMLYMWVKYDNPSSFMDQNNQLNTFKAWHDLDPVDYKEKIRNDVVETYQNNRNPFIDCPQFVDALYQ